MKLFSIFKTKTLDERTQAKIRKKNTRTKKKSAVGDIYYVHPEHVIPAKDLKAYGKKKKNYNKRPVAIVEEKKNGEVDIAKIYGTPGKSQLVSNKKRVPLSTTKTTKRSWIDTTNKTTSEKTGEPFKKGTAPLTKRKGKVTSRDLVARDIAIKQKKSLK